MVGDPEPVGDAEPEAVGDPESGPDVVGDPGADADGSGVAVGEAGGDGDGAGEGDGGEGDGDGVGVQPGVGTGAAFQVTGIVSAPGKIWMTADPPLADWTATATPARWPRPSVPPRLLRLTWADELRADQVTGPCGAAIMIVPADRYPRSSAPG